MLRLGRPQGSLAGHHQHGQLTEAGLLDNPIMPAADSLPASSIPTFTEEEAGLDRWDPSPSSPAASLSGQFSPCTFCKCLEKLQLTQGFSLQVFRDRDLYSSAPHPTPGWSPRHFS